MNKSGALLLSGLGLVAAGANAVTIDDELGNRYELAGFAKVEWSTIGEAKKVIPDPLSAFTIDNRNALNVPAVGLTTPGPKTSKLTMHQITLAITHEMDSALALEARLTHRWRSSLRLGDFLTRTPDVDYKTGSSISQMDFYEKFVGISRPDLGALRIGTQLTKTWSRSDSFSFPIGLSSQWADSGAGFGILPSAVRVTSPIYEDGSGKLSGELTVARNELNTNNVDQSLVKPGPTTPNLVELFFQYSRDKHLIELTIQSASGAKQTSFGKSALVGWIGDPDTSPPQSPNAGLPRRSGKPSQSVVLLQGSYWPDAENMLTWGVRRNRWSGSAPSCNFDRTRAICIFGIDPGFNYGPPALDYRGFKAETRDVMLAWSHYQGPVTYSVGGVYFGKARSDNPIEWGQSNSAFSLNLGISRRVPELLKGMSVAAGLAIDQFSRLGPAPLSMPGNSFLSPNSLYDRKGYSLTLGTTVAF